jgi:hypothetical protein
MLCGLVMSPYLSRERELAPAIVAAHVQQPNAASTTNGNTANEAKVAPRVDTQVKPAVANLPIAEQVVEDLVLPAGEILRVEHLELKPHIRVRGRGGSRPRISVPRSGLLVGCDDVTFDSVDFVWDVNASGSSVEAAKSPAMLHMQAATVNFRGCSFSSPAGDAPAAIRIATAQEALPGLGGELAFTNCVFDGVSAVLEVATSSSLAVRMNHCLCVAAGPMLLLPRPPGPDARLSLALDHVTTRGDSSVLECHYGRRASQFGAISIVASNSALAGGGRGGLIQLVGVERPDQLLTKLAWAGQGAIALPNTPLVVWRRPENRGVANHRHALPEEGLDVAGLVRGELEFAGRPDGPPAASRVTRWQVPLRSPDPPGADPNLLSSPRGNARP